MSYNSNQGRPTYDPYQPTYANKTLGPLFEPYKRNIAANSVLDMKNDPSLSAVDSLQDMSRGPLGPNYNQYSNTTNANALMGLKKWNYGGRLKPKSKKSRGGKKSRAGKKNRAGKKSRKMH